MAINIKKRPSREAIEQWLSSISIRHGATRLPSAVARSKKKIMRKLMLLLDATGETQVHKVELLRLSAPVEKEKKEKWRMKRRLPRVELMDRSKSLVKGSTIKHVDRKEEVILVAKR